MSDEATSATDAIETSIELPDNLKGLPVVRLKKRRALPFFNRHPWVFAGAIHSAPDDLEVGDEVLVESFKNEPIARGLFNPVSNIRVRLYSWDFNQACDSLFIAERIHVAVGYRRQLQNQRADDPPEQQAIRLINSEGDGLSGLTVDQFANHLCLQLTSAALATQLETIKETLVSACKPSGIWLRTEKGIGEAEGMEIDEDLIYGEASESTTTISENGIQYEVDLAHGQKTGFYCDQRDNRRVAASYFAAGKILDVCCYSGGFGLNAVIHGQAESVEAIDSSQSALDLAAKNAELNGVADKFQFEKSAAVAALQARLDRGDVYDGVILDPPKMARNRGGLGRAMKGYAKLNQLAVRLLKPGGILVTCSCSGLVSRDLFEEMLADVATQTDRRIQILEARGAAADHPVSVSCRESDYLKCYICRVI